MPKTLIVTYNGVRLVPVRGANNYTYNGVTTSYTYSPEGLTAKQVIKTYGYVHWLADWYGLVKVVDAP